MEDLTGLGKLAESEIAKRVYEDALSAPLKEIGALTTDVVKSLRLVTAPLQLLAAYQDRLVKFLQRVREGVSEDQQQLAAPEIAGPILQAIIFVQDDTPLMDMYVNLLRRAIDRERASEAHPAFHKIIEQLSPDESLMLFWAKKETRALRVHVLYPNGPDPLLSLHPDQLQRMAFPQNAQMYLWHLKSLGVTEFDNVNYGDDAYYEFARLSDFGRLFAQACIPDEWNF